MPIFRKDGKSILFVHIPKTAGSTIEQMFGKSGFDVLYRDPHTRPGSVNRLRRCSPQHMHASMLAGLFRLEQFDAVFMTVRDPIARFRSEYAMRATSLVPSAEAVEQWADRAFADYNRDSFLFDNHLRPQVEFLLPGAHVYRLEDGLERAVADMSRRLGIDVTTEVPRAMDRARESGIPSSKVELSPRLIARLRAMYHQDFVAFGYPEPATSAAQPIGSSATIPTHGAPVSAVDH